MDLDSNFGLTHGIKKNGLLKTLLIIKLFTNYCDDIYLYDRGIGFLERDEYLLVYILLLTVD